MPVADLEGFRALCEPKKDCEFMIWTVGGHYFRGTLDEVDERGFLVLKDVSCTLAGERQEREVVHVAVHAVDAFSWE